MHMILTTKGELPEDQLARTLGFELRPEPHYVVWVEWRHQGELVRRDLFQSPKTPLDQPIATSKGQLPPSELRRTIELEDTDNEIVVAEVFRYQDEVVKRSAHVILKRASVLGSAAVGGFQ